jgi:hypothetical protein
MIPRLVLDDPVSFATAAPSPTKTGCKKKRKLRE